ncbi:hypothetical protein F511_06919 [Dorcoceras hygrometricum]|uniref:Uncharacterized protein n=1 Tax=Dorcoceras hygrometricum TaxID=472368 RepID=A0A2Z7B8N2_9LAMI|nr:hypothetical protein F511_06919 [Dorcoceras hygrometricum]
MVKRLETSPHDPLRITDSACKNQSIMVSVQYGPFNSNIPNRSTTIGKSRVARDPITMHTSWRSNSEIACVISLYLRSQRPKEIKPLRAIPAKAAQDSIPEAAKEEAEIAQQEGISITADEDPIPEDVWTPSGGDSLGAEAHDESVNGGKAFGPHLRILLYTEVILSFISMRDSHHRQYPDFTYHLFFNRLQKDIGGHQSATSLDIMSDDQRFVKYDFQLFNKVFYCKMNDLLDSMNQAQILMKSRIVRDMNGNHQKLSDEVILSVLKWLKY